MQKKATLIPCMYFCYIQYILFFLSFSLVFSSSLWFCFCVLYCVLSPSLPIPIPLVLLCHKCLIHATVVVSSHHCLIHTTCGCVSHSCHCGCVASLMPLPRAIVIILSTTTITPSDHCSP